MTSVSGKVKFNFTTC